MKGCGKKRRAPQAEHLVGRKVSLMNPWKLIKDRVVFSRKEDEAFYAAALDEFQSSQLRPGLMAKAMAESSGDEQMAKAVYIKLLAAAIHDDHYIAQRTQEELLQASQRMVEEHRKAQEVALAAENAPRLNETPRKSNFAESFGGLMAVLVFGGWFLLKDDDPASKVTRQAPATTQSSYDVVLASYEKAYPQINPDSPAFSRALTDRIAERMDFYRNSGQTDESALRLAASELLESQKPAQKPTPTRSPPVETPQKRRCEFKQVMTDEDYRACGIKPPSTS